MILLDTCTLLWLVMDQAKLSAPVRQSLRAQAGLIHVSAVTAFEIGLKHGAGKLELPLPPGEWFPRVCQACGLLPVDLTPAQALAAAALPPLHRDPFDRLLVATAQARSLTLLTPDPLIRQYPGLASLW